MSFSKVKQFLIGIYQDNLNNYADIIDKTGQTLIPAIENTVCYDKTTPIDCKENYKTEIDVVNMDAIDCARELQEQKFNPVVLNLASEMHPGGGWQKGCLAQEECLFYRSTYALSLDLKIRSWYTEIIDSVKKNCNIPEKTLKTWKFPISKYTGIYSPNVFIFRDADYNMMKWKECYYMSFVAMPGLRHPKLVGGKYTKEDSDLLKEKIRTVLRIGLMNGHDSSILGALGCGVFGCPEEETAEHFCEVLIEPEFHNKYKKIRFAVLSKGKNSNYDIFNKVISKFFKKNT